MKKSFLGLLVLTSFPLISASAVGLLAPREETGQIVKRSAVHISEIDYLAENPADPHRPADYITSSSISSNKSQMSEKGIVRYSLDYSYFGNYFNLKSMVSFSYLPNDDFWVTTTTYSIVLRNKTSFDYYNPDFVNIVSTDTVDKETKIVVKLFKLPTKETNLLTINTNSVLKATDQDQYNACINTANNLIGNGNQRLMTRMIKTFRRDEAYILNDGGETTVYLDVDDAVSVENILANINAKDLFGADVSISATENSYATHKLGTYDIPIIARDKFGQTAHAVIHAVVMDYVAPTVNTATVEFNCTDDISFGSFTSKLDCTDNYYGKSDIVYELIDNTNNLRWNTRNNCGNYIVTVAAKDPSGQVSQSSVTITVLDNVPPTIKDLSGNVPAEPIQVGVTALSGSPEEIINSLFIVEDNNDKSILLSIKSGTIEKKIGTYDLILSASDSSGNIAECHVMFEVIADALPVFMLNPLFAVSTVENPLSVGNVESLIRKAIPSNAANLVIDVQDLESFSDNCRRGGENKIRFSYSDAEGKNNDSWLIVKVTDSKKGSGNTGLILSWKLLFGNISDMTLINWLYIILTLVLIASTIGLVYYVVKALIDRRKRHANVNNDGIDYDVGKTELQNKDVIKNGQNDIISLDSEDYTEKKE